MNNFKFTMNVNNEAMDFVVHASDIDYNVENCCWDAYQHQCITVIDVNTKRRFSFDYHGGQLASMVNSEHDALIALDDVLNDASQYENDDCKDIIYNLDIVSANKIYNACKKQYYKIARWLKNCYSNISLDDFWCAVSETLNNL